MPEEQSESRPQRRPHGHGPMMYANSGEKPRNARQTLVRLVARLKPSALLLTVVFVLAVAGTLCNTVSPLVLGQATTEIYEAYTRVIDGTGGLDYMALDYILLTLFSLYLASAVFQFFQSFIMARVTQNLIYGIREEMKQKLDRVPLSYYDGRPKGEILSRVTNDVDLISTTLQETLVQIVSATVTLLSVVIFMFSISWILTLVAFITLPISLLCTVGVAKRSQRYFKNQQDALGNLNAHIEEMYGGYAVVKAFAREDYAVDEFTRRNEEYFSHAWKAQFLSGVIRPLIGFVGNLGYVIVCVVGAMLFITGGIGTIGQIQAFIQYMRQFTMPITQIASIANTIQATLAASERVFELLDVEEMVEVSDEEALAIDPPCQGRVTFEHVRFGYTPETTVIEDFSLEVEPGQMVAIVGPTGAGKTTLVNLLMRFYEIDGGAITLDGVDVSRMKATELRSHLGMVLQETWLFSGSIRDNIAYGADNPPEEEIVLAAKLARAHHFIQTLPDGYDTHINEEGTNISQGQKQLITIARALLSRPQVLILDEATSSIDTQTELLVQEAMRESLVGRTSFVIAHRLSTIRDADRILVLKDGGIVEQGKHDELLAQGGFYAQLYESQFADCIDGLED